VKRYASRYSVGQRLAFGFGVLFALQLAVMAGVFVWLQENDKAQDEFVTRILPRAALAEQLEHAVFYVAVAARDQLLEPGAEHARAFEQAAERARGSMDFLSTVRVSTERDAQYAQMRTLLQYYVAEAETLRVKRTGRPLEELAELREATLNSIREFTQQERTASRAALDGMAQNRRRIWTLLAWLAGGSAAAFLVAGWLTARSIRRPARRLVEFASAMEAGNWRSALSLAPASFEAAHDTRDEMQHVGFAFGAAAVALEAREQQLQQKSEELQAQNEEIQAQNEEIQAQNEEIQAQSEEIQTQNEELETQSEELRGRNAVLERLTHDLETRAARLAEADAQKNAFLGMLAHELRNPMAAMTVSLQLLHRVPPDSDRSLRARAVIDRQVQHMTRLIDDLLDVTRISRGKVSLRSEPVDLVQIVRSCEDDAHASFEARGLVLQVETPDAPVWVQGDRTRLCQVVNNLLHNAGKFTREGGRVRLQLTVGPDGEAMIRVTDTGTGIDPQLLPRLFQPFSQGSTTLARTGGGLGLGLALVKALVDLHGGRVEAHSDGPGRGATFTVHLPLQDAVRPAHRARPTAVATRRWRILLVEDNSDAAWSLGEALALDGHDVEVATSGEEAIDKARLAKPELVLCDIGLPAMDGYEIARRFRADAELKGTLLVALTGYASETDRSQATAAGFDGHLAKPLRMDELAQVLAEFEVAGGTA
jgi:signal transduction histidine kinase/CheY-like chemotaxis protein